MALVGSGAMKREDVNKESLKKYLAEHPEGEGWILSQNPRYAFFDVAEAPADGEPFGTIQEPLTAGRSLAVDPKFAALGTAAYVMLPMAQANSDGQLLGKSQTARLAFCQDTGGAIQGPGRVDLYLGHGPQAKTEASNVWDAGDLYLLIKKFPPRLR
jgi:membrane-bound lytic murein transglycosylase A